MRFETTLLAVKDMNKSLTFYKEIFDPDYHMIEVGESMKKIAFNEFEKGLTTEEVSKKIEHPFDVVNNWHREYNEH